MHPRAEPDPEQMLADARRRDTDALGPLLELYRNYLNLLARTQIDRHLRGRASASDLVQETFLQACGHFAQFRGTTETELMGWLRRILLNILARAIEREILTQKRDVRKEVSLHQRVAELQITLDYVLKEYRDSQISQWLFGKGSGVFRRLGIERVRSAPGADAHNS